MALNGQLITALGLKNQNQNDTRPQGSISKFSNFRGKNQNDPNLEGVNYILVFKMLL
jgi:hypothetical protein